MNTNRLYLVSIALASLLAARAADPAKPPCCAELCATTPTASSAAASFSPRSLYQLDAEWTNDASATVRLSSLRGRPVVVAMFFANCEYACPMLVADMKRVRDGLPVNDREKVQFVLVSFDSVRDTPAALMAYRESRGLDASWTLLRSDATAVQDLAMLLGVKFKQDARGQFAHSNTVTVLNSEGEIAGQRNGLGGDVSDLTKTVVAVKR